MQESAAKTTSEVRAPPGELSASIAAGVLLLAGVVAEKALGLEWGVWLSWASLAIGFVYGGWAAGESIVGGRFDIDVLMIIGAGLAAYLGHPEEGALLLFLFTLSGALEDRAMQRTKREIEALHKLMPVESLLWSGGEWRAVAPESLRPGDRIKVRPGDRVPTDCRVLAGRSSMDQSAITGESMPRLVEPGDSLYAGSVNTDDTLEAEVTKAASESSLQKILKLVTEAREQREPAQRAIDRLSQPYSIGVMVLAGAILVGWRYGLGRAWEDAAYTAITLLIVASPCALVIATPTATLAAIARAARSGVLFKGGAAIDALANVSSVCFDKTGTLTIGRPRLFEVHPVAWSDGRSLLAIAAGLERDSTHPIAAAVREAAAERGVEAARVEDLDHTTGRGMAGRVGGCPVRLGSYKHTEELIPVCFRARVLEVLEKIQARGHLGVVVAHACPGAAGGGEAAVLIMADAVRPNAARMVRELHELNVRPLRMLTGDNRRTAERVAQSLGLDRFDAELLPQDKVAAVREMKADAERKAGGSGAFFFGAPRGGVAVIGDGVNDAPALAAADVSIAIGSIGSDAALESADIVLLSDDLAAVPWAIRLARRARRTVTFNIVLALTIIGVMGVLTVVGSLFGVKVPLSLGVVAHEGGTLLVVANSLRLLFFGGMGRHESREEARESVRAAAATP